jgi:aspartyl-tRNA(Asn)/glutamyl-tRNA(Gln) amidotransferase subunit A
MTRRDWLAMLAGGPVAARHVLGARAAAAQPLDATSLSMAELASAYRDGALTPIDVTAAYLARIDRENPALGAYVTVARDRALDDTRRLLLGARGGGPRPPLFGVPVAHKDLLQTRGVPTAGGSRLYAGEVPSEDADLVRRLARAGAITLGKTNTHELGGGVTTINPFFGPTRNPHDPSRIPGGSSGGSAAAVVARLTLIATGSDTGGSVRIPAALSGCVGFKPSFGLLPTTGLLGACPTFDHLGLLARSVDDITGTLAAVVPAGADGAPGDERGAGASSPAPGAGLRGLRVGVARAYFFDELAPAVARHVARALDLLADAGAALGDVEAGVTAETYATLFDPVAVSEIRATYARAWRARPEAFSREFAAVFDGPRIDDRDLARALAAREAFERRIDGLFGDVDVLVLPTVPVTAPRIDGPIDGMRILRNTWAWNAARTPALSLPVGADADGLPVGLQLIGRRGADRALLAAGARIARLVAA